MSRIQQVGQFYDTMSGVYQRNIKRNQPLARIMLNFMREKIKVNWESQESKVTQEWKIWVKSVNVKKVWTKQIYFLFIYNIQYTICSMHAHQTQENDNMYNMYKRSTQVMDVLISIIWINVNILEDLLQKITWFVMLITIS